MSSNAACHGISFQKTFQNLFQTPGANADVYSVEVRTKRFAKASKNLQISQKTWSKKEKIKKKNTEAESVKTW